MARMITAESLAQLSSAMRRRAGSIAQALTEFRALPAYMRLAGVARAPLRGQTLDRANALSDKLCQLFEALDRIYAELDLADEAIEAGSGMLGNSQRLLEAQARLTPDAMDHLAADIRQVQEEVEVLDLTWSQLQQKTLAAYTETGSLRELVSSADASAAHQIERVRAKLEALREMVEVDPLSAAAVFAAEVESPLAGLRQTIGAAAAAKRQLTDGLADAAALLVQLHTLADEAQAAFLEATEKTSGVPLSAPPSLQALAQWLEVLQAEVGDGKCKPALIGLQHWHTQAEVLREQMNASRHAAGAVLQARRELRGLLRALRAKAVARGTVEDPALVQLASEADTLLYQRPTPMPRAEQLVREYERVLNGR